ncbi:MAG TPA: SAM-dependent methyltransferase [Chromatiales bacterium]|nr:SAM-dependent methyltransferase [Chromatiales bacterium]
MAVAPAIPPRGLPEPPPEARAHAGRVAARIAAEIEAAGGAISFERYMELALYAPGLGYYVAGARKLGPAGDYVTAPELGGLFARCLAVQCAEILERCGGDTVVELGAGSGALAAGLLAALEAAGAAPRRYAIVEVSPELRERQQATLAARAGGLAARVEWWERLPAPGSVRGVIVANELLDALPVHRFRIRGGRVRMLGVARAGEGFGWVELDPEPALERAVRAVEADLGRTLPDGYTSELCLRLAPWVATVTGLLGRGAALFVDYGHPRAEYYHETRRDGTLMCHYRHRAHGEPLVLAGLQDITAHVDFTAVAEAGAAAGAGLLGYTTQAWFLMGCGLERHAQALATAPERERWRLAQEVRTLTLPTEMGERFKAIALGRGIEGPLAGFALRDERHRL